MTDYFEQAANAILQRIECPGVDASDFRNDSPYFFNENYGKSLNEAVLPQAATVYDEDSLQSEGALITKYVEIAAAQILEAFSESMKGKVLQQKLMYITDPDLLAAISRKTTQLHSMLKSCYDKDIAKELIEQAIRRQLKYLAINA